MTPRNQREIDDMLSSNINKWVISYFQMFTCQVILRAFTEPVERNTINKNLQAEMNTMLRRLAKFKKYVSPECYNNMIESIRDLKDETRLCIIKALNEEGDIL